MNLQTLVDFLGTNIAHDDLLTAYRVLCELQQDEMVMRPDAEEHSEFDQAIWKLEEIARTRKLFFSCKLEFDTDDMAHCIYTLEPLWPASEFDAEKATQRMQWLDAQLTSKTPGDHHFYAECKKLDYEGARHGFAYKWDHQEQQHTFQPLVEHVNNGNA